MPAVDSDDEFGSADELMANLDVDVAAAPAPPPPPHRPPAPPLQPVVIDSDDEFGVDNELNDLMAGIDEHQLRQTARPHAPATASTPQRTNNIFRPPTAAAHATGGQVTLHGGTADLRPKGVLSIQNTSPNQQKRSSKRWDKSYAAASGPLRNRRTMPRPGDPYADEDEAEVEDWDADRSGHPLANVGLFGPGVRGTSSTSTSKLPDASFSKYLSSNPTRQSMADQVDVEAAMTWIYPTNMPIRDYQFNIVQKALFNNVLVALPTGLGKTFIAAVVMLNYFRWYPKGKIIFVAPTRPLVAQQQVACHRICGLPWDVAVELTGEVKSTMRQTDYQEKRIFYMTPQTLANDLKLGLLNPHDVVCLVIDEAHRGTGNYAYTVIVAMLMQFNRFFRILALSATPGKSPDVVQQIVDKLHISAIEIRTPDAIDIFRYVHHKQEAVVPVAPHPVITQIKQRFCKLLDEVYLNGLRSFQLLRGDQRADMITPYVLRRLQTSETSRTVLRAKPFLRTTINKAATAVQALTFLLDSSTMIFRDRLLAICEEDKSKGGPFRRTSTEVQAMLALVDKLKVPGEGFHHPKLKILHKILEDHFNQGAIVQAQRGDQGPSSSRAMVFCSSRECVEEITTRLSQRGISACRFVGQQSDRKGAKGMPQKEQKKAIADFQTGEYQVLVATSVGEEGLDIGEVDLIVCYDSVADPVRMLQRIGRTGRKREGKVVVLVTPGRDEGKWNMAKTQHQQVLRSITMGHYELYDDVPRMIPDHITPQVVKQPVDQPEFDPDMIDDGRGRRGRAKGAKKGKKKKDQAELEQYGSFSKASELARSKYLLSESEDDGSPVPAGRAQPPSDGISKIALAMQELEDSSDEDLPLMSDLLSFDGPSNPPKAQPRPSVTRPRASAESGKRTSLGRLACARTPRANLSGRTSPPVPEPDWSTPALKPRKAADPPSTGVQRSAAHPLLAGLYAMADDQSQGPQRARNGSGSGDESDDLPLAKDTRKAAPPATSRTRARPVSCPSSVRPPPRSRASRPSDPPARVDPPGIPPSRPEEEPLFLLSQESATHAVPPANDADDLLDDDNDLALDGVDWNVLDRVGAASLSRSREVRLRGRPTPLSTTTPHPQATEREDSAETDMPLAEVVFPRKSREPSSDSQPLANSVRSPGERQESSDSLPLVQSVRKGLQLDDDLLGTDLALFTSPPVSPESKVKSSAWPVQALSMEKAKSKPLPTGEANAYSSPGNPTVLAPASDDNAEQLISSDPPGAMTAPVPPSAAKRRVPNKQPSPAVAPGSHATDPDESLGPGPRAPKRARPTAHDDDSSPIVPVRRQVTTTVLSSSPETLKTKLSRFRCGPRPAAPPSEPATRGHSERLRADAKAQRKAGHARKKRIGRSPTSRGLFEMEAELSGVDESEDEVDEEEEEGDLSNIGNFLPTQVPGYNQHAAYAQSLMQDRGLPPMFRRPARRLVSSPATQRAEDSQDRYTNDSFCVGDDLVEYASDSEVADRTI